MVVSRDDGTSQVFQLLHVLEFNSTRKRMSVILKDQNGQIRLICKGADSIIQARLEKAKPTQDLFKITDRFLADYAKNGLRTLLIAEKILDPSYYEVWAEKYYQASIAL